MSAAILSADFAYAIEDFNTMLGCPQCLAERRMTFWRDVESPEAHAWRLACWDVLTSPHECGAIAAEPLP